MNLKLDYKWVVLTVTTVGSLMASIDNGIVIIGLPTILDSLHTTVTAGIWIITGYGLMQTMLMVVLGRISDIYGRVKLYNLGFAVFTVGSLLCGLSTNGAQLVGFRFLQGAGAALLTANAVTIITDAFPSNQLGMALGINMMAFSFGAVGGFTLSGLLISAFGWRSIFLVNIPIGMFGTVWAYMRLKETVIRPLEQKFDYVGSIIYCVALSTVLVALAVGDPASPRNLAILVIGLLLFVAVIIVENRQKFPTLDLTLFKIRAFAIGNLTFFLNNIAFNCAPFLQSLYLQLILGYSPAKAGIILIPMEAVVLLVAPISGRLSDRYGSRVLSSIGLAVNAAALFWFSTLNQQSSYLEILISLLLLGIGRSIFVSPNVSAIMGSVPAAKRGVANGLRMTVAMTGGVLSVPLSLLLMTIVMPYSRLSQIAGGAQLAGTTESLTFLHAINRACLILGIVILFAIIPSMMRGPRVNVNKRASTTEVIE